MSAVSRQTHTDLGATSSSRTYGAPFDGKSKGEPVSDPSEAACGQTTTYPRGRQEPRGALYMVFPHPPLADGLPSQGCAIICL
jgi:hypothetical protein